MPALQLNELTPELMLRAYGAGIFPMARDSASEDLLWFDPDPRGVLPLDGLHIPRRLKKLVRQAPFDMRIDSDFAGVMRKCGPARQGGEKTWINRSIERACLDLFAQGYAHSVEAWRDGMMVGGLYGVALGGAFFGESMFSEADNASKVALVHLVARLRVGGFTLLDTQFVTDHLSQFGAIEIPRGEYKRRLDAATGLQGNFWAVGSGGGSVAGTAEGAGTEEAALVASFLQSTTHIS